MPSASRLLQAACLCALAALGLMGWSIFDPRPLQVIVALSAGQLLGTLSFVSFLLVVVADLRGSRTAVPRRGAGEGPDSRSAK